MPPLLPQARPAVFWAEPFDSINPERWREVEVKRHARYEEAVLDGRACLRATSQNSASILLSSIRFNPEVYKWFSWEWRVDQLVANEALDRKSGSDAAARVYVYFQSPGLAWQKRNLDYVWSTSLPVGTILDSAFSPQSKIIVVESGTSALDHWRKVERNLEEDYERCFSQRLPDVIAIGIMSDTDNTGGEALAYFDDFRVSRLPLLRRQAEQAESGVSQRHHEEPRVRQNK